jgi:hypothetical protein
LPARGGAGAGIGGFDECRPGHGSAATINQTLLHRRERVSGLSVEIRTRGVFQGAANYRRYLIKKGNLRFIFDLGQGISPFVKIQSTGNLPISIKAS